MDKSTGIWLFIVRTVWIWDNPHPQLPGRTHCLSWKTHHRKAWIYLWALHAHKSILAKDRPIYQDLNYNCIWSHCGAFLLSKPEGHAWGASGRQGPGDDVILLPWSPGWKESEIQILLKKCFLYLACFTTRVHDGPNPIYRTLKGLSGFRLTIRGKEFSLVN